MPADNESRRDLQCKLDWEPGLKQAVERINGLQGVINQLSVRTSVAADALRRSASAPTDSISAKGDMASLTLEGDDWIDNLRDRGHTFAYLSRQAVDIAEGLGSDPIAAVLLGLASGFDRLAGAFGTAHEVGTAVRRRP